MAFGTSEWRPPRWGSAFRDRRKAFTRVGKWLPGPPKGVYPGGGVPSGTSEWRNLREKLKFAGATWCETARPSALLLVFFLVGIGGVADDVHLLLPERERKGLPMH